MAFLNSRHVAKPLRSFKEPGEFVTRIDEIYSSMPLETYDLLELADGRVFERF